MSKPTKHRNALPIGHQLQEYRLDSLLGHGGFGITYLAHDTELDAAVAIKEYLPNELAVREGDLSVQPKSPQDADDFAWGLERFIQEARTLARFNHPNIVRVRRFFRAHNTAYIVMDYEQGRSLAQAIKEGETAQEAELMSLLPPLLDGLKTVHDAGYLHRDIKPGNIYLRDKDNSPVLIDFGTARYDVGSRSRSVTTIVSPGYSPFEQYQTKSNQGPWTDIYALGAVLYRSIGGATPVESTERIDAIIYNTPDPLKPAVELGQRRYSKRLLKAIDYALQARETERPQNVTELKKAILSPSRPQQQPPPPKKQKSSFFKRAAVFVFVVMLVAAIGLVGYPHWQKWWIEQKIAEQLEEKQQLAQLRQAEKAIKAKEQRLAQLRRQQQEAEKARKAEEQRLVQLRRQQQEAERARQAEEQQLAQLQRQQQEAERAIKAEEQRLVQLRLQQQEAERTIKAEEQRLAQLRLQQQEAEKAIKAEEQRLVQLRHRAEEARKWTPGNIFRDRLQDGTLGPEMVVIPAGRFLMGDIQGGGESDEQPVHWVSVDRFAMAKYEVTFAEYDKFAEATGRGKPSDRGWGRGNRPVINVSWHDITAYAEWLSQQTGQHYRLPTEVEWEYAARAGTTTKYWWGNTASHKYANYGKNKCCGGLARSKDRWKYISPVGSFEPNPFGLHDTTGNVWEWTCSEYEDRYSGKEQRCVKTAGRFAVRSASWFDMARRARSANRSKVAPTVRFDSGGARLAKMP